MSDSGNEWFDFFRDRRFVPLFFVTLAVLFGVPLGIALFFAFVPVMRWHIVRIRLRTILRE